VTILIDEKTRFVVQGITGKGGSFHTLECMKFGTDIVGGVTPGRGGSKFDDRVPIFDTMEEAVSHTGANASLVFVPAFFAADAILEAAWAGIEVIVCITEGIPVLDMVKIHHVLEGMETRLIGPNCAGIISPPAKCMAGIMPSDIHLPGRVGVVSRSGTLTYETIKQLTDLGIGQSTSVGIGGDPLPGTSFVDVLRMFDADPETDLVVLIGEIGGMLEQQAADYIKEQCATPVVATVVGASAPPGKQMGHAGAIVTSSDARAEEKINALSDAGATIAPSPADLGVTVQKVLGG
jgi:succinyl-CoA synthetase alpha subunit